MRISRTFVCFLLLSPVFAAAPAHAREADAPLPIVPAADVDEPLFLVRVLETTYASWPQDLTDRQWLQAWLIQTRGQVSRLRALIRSENLNQDVAQLYDDCLAMLDAYETYLANLGAIDRGAVLQASRDQAKVTETAFRMSYNTAASAKQEGKSTSEALAGGFLAGLISGAFESYQRSTALDEMKQQQLEAQTRKLQGAWTSTRANAEVLVSRLTRTCAWRPGEAGFDRFTSNRMGDLIERRPRDPFLRVANSAIRVEGETPEAILQDARNCLVAATLVPKNPVYDPYRAECLAAAADIANLACAKELPETAYSSGPAKSGPEALRICRTLLSFDPGDASGTGHMQLARALAFLGRYPEAVAAANQATSYFQDTYFSYRFARLLSLVGETDKSIEWLTHALKLGFSDIAALKADPDLVRVRTERPEVLNDLTRVKFSWSIGWGIINPDEIVLENTSLFPITDVTFKVTVTSSGYADWADTLTCETIPAGTRHTWYIRGAGITSRGSDARGQGVLSCAQNP